MKRKLAVVIVLVALALLGSCDFFGNTVSMDQCIANFMAAVNNDKASVYKSLSSESIQYGVALSGSYWDTRFPSGNTYTLSSKSTSGMTVSANLNGWIYIDDPITFDFEQDVDGNYVISTINLSGYGAIFY